MIQAIPTLAKEGFRFPWQKKLVPIVKADNVVDSVIKLILTLFNTVQGRKALLYLFALGYIPGIILNMLFPSRYPSKLPI